MLVSSMLPKMLTENEDMADILKAEQQEIEILQQEIQKNLNQLAISTADDLLSRYERIYDVSGRNMTIQERRKQLLSKKNARYSCTKENLQNDLINMTGLPVNISEVFSDYLFQVELIQNSLSDAFVLAIRNFLDTVKPAHMDYSLSLVRYEENYTHMGASRVDSTLQIFEEVY